MKIKEFEGKKYVSYSAYLKLREQNCELKDSLKASIRLSKRGK